ncbi:olfactory receptor 5V1-like [Rhinatrema bivittatum]|uniref:olfactory receptor 5V1-like n=1 Tax=Rhinatrema bivittatum TaxID=194408 RepID=UPI00112CD4D9|nr:olfactory receptor 5V1-like [Rhinatrema bivittatum]
MSENVEALLGFQELKGMGEFWLLLSPLRKERKMRNQTTIMEFIIKGFSDTEEFQMLYFFVFLLIYIITVLGNLLIILLTCITPKLHTPMYFFLNNLSFIDVCYTSTTVPKILATLLTNQRTISYVGCVTQLYLVVSFAATESCLLASMAYDRYVAICIPLRYAIIMHKKVYILLTVASWIISSLYSIVHTVNTFRLPFCGSNVVNHFFCEIPPLLKIACANTYINELLVFALGGFLFLGGFLLIAISYVFIISSILNITSKEGRNKSFSTCVSHLIVVTLFYGSGSFMYMQPTSRYSMTQARLMAVFYTIVTPMLNPIIYSLRNKEIKGAFRKLISRNEFTHRM